MLTQFLAQHQVHNAITVTSGCYRLDSEVVSPVGSQDEVLKYLLTSPLITHKDKSNSLFAISELSKLP